MARYQNPDNGFTEEANHPFLWTLLFGVFYFAVKGIWAHAAIAFICAFFTFGISWLIYPFFARGIVEKHYLRQGWVKLEE
jgi:hypothetical protein